MKNQCTNFEEMPEVNRPPLENRLRWQDGVKIELK
jgi:hypothetical protein